MIQGDGNEENGGPWPGRAEDVRENNDDLDIALAPFLEPHIQEQLGRVLRSFCDDLIHQPIPDKFVVLLARLEAKQRERK
jgi:hypothetical protein